MHPSAQAMDAHLELTSRVFAAMHILDARGGIRLTKQQLYSINS